MAKTLMHRPKNKKKDGSWNEVREDNGFYDQINFSETLIPYKWTSDWIPEKVEGMIALINQHEVPNPNPSCKNCAYAKQRTMLNLM